MNGGYSMIDLTGVKVGGEAQTIDGLWQSVYTAMDANKPIYGYNILSAADGLYTPVLCICDLSGDQTINVKTAVVNFTISTANVVTVTA